MKRHALLIGYAGGGSTGEAYLSGVSYDLENYKNFLMSSKGGAWYNHEITTIDGSSKRELLSTIDKVRRENNDVTFTIFTGHGDFENKENFCRSLLINDKGESILEKDLYRISKKEILILDCCSELRYKSTNESIAERKNIIAEESTVFKILARSKYEEICKSCPDQKLRFYAAEVGYSAEDTDEGGLYSTALLKILNKTNKDIDIVEAHNQARTMVINESDGEQIPSKRVDKVIKYLPGAILI